MRIDLSIGKKTTTLRWKYLDENKSIRLPGRIDAKFSKRKNFIVASGTAGSIYVLSCEGEVIYEFHNGTNENRKFYCLANTSCNDLGVNIVMAHEPEINGERFWQYSIDIESQRIENTRSKWR